MSNEAKAATKNARKEAKMIMNSKQLASCHFIIHSYSAAAAAAGATPIPVADAIPISAAQIAMVVSLGNVFKQKIGKTAAKAAINASLSTVVGRSIVKALPVAGMIISAAVAASITEFIGWTQAVNFAKNAKLSWDAEHAPEAQNDASDEANTAEQELDDFIKDLMDRAIPFLNKETKVSENRKEYDKLINDFESVLDQLAPDLKTVYNQLCDLVLEQE